MLATFGGAFLANVAVGISSAFIASEHVAEVPEHSAPQSMKEFPAAGVSVKGYGGTRNVCGAAGSWARYSGRRAGHGAQPYHVTVRVKLWGGGSTMCEFELGFPPPQAVRPRTSNNARRFIRHPQKNRIGKALALGEWI